MNAGEGSAGALPPADAPMPAVTIVAGDGAGGGASSGASGVVATAGGSGDGGGGGEPPPPGAPAPAAAGAAGAPAEGADGGSIELLPSLTGVPAMSTSGTPAVYFALDSRPDSGERVRWLVHKRTHTRTTAPAHESPMCTLLWLCACVACVRRLRHMNACADWRRARGCGCCGTRAAS